MIDNFRRTPKQNPNEEYSYHLWHISAGLNEDEEAAYPYISFSQAIWNLTWETVPAELRSVSVLFWSTEYCAPNFSLIVQHQALNDTPLSLSEIFGAVFGGASLSSSSYHPLVTLQIHNRSRMRT
jgi:hypothetical protein